MKSRISPGWLLAAGLALLAGIAVAGQNAADLARAGWFSPSVLESFDEIIQLGTPVPGDPEHFARPMLGAGVGWRALSGAENLSDYLLMEEGMETLLSQFLAGSSPREFFPLPPVLSVIIWTRLSSEAPSQLLLGLGERSGDYLTLATDLAGAPVVVLHRPDGGTDVSRAARGAANLADDRLHCVVVMVNMAAGLVRTYVDGQPESARIFGTWRCRKIGQAFAFWLAGDRPATINHPLFLPRVVVGELNDDEIRKLKPAPAKNGSPSPDAFPALESDLKKRLLVSGLVEFLPLNYQPCGRPFGLTLR